VVVPRNQDERLEQVEPLAGRVVDLHVVDGVGVAEPLHDALPARHHHPPVGKHHQAHERPGEGHVGQALDHHRRPGYVDQVRAVADGPGPVVPRSSHRQDPARVEQDRAPVHGVVVVAPEPGSPTREANKSAREAWGTGPPRSVGVGRRKKGETYPANATEPFPPRCSQCMFLDGPAWNTRPPSASNSHMWLSDLVMPSVSFVRSVPLAAIPPSSVHDPTPDASSLYTSANLPPWGPLHDPPSRNGRPSLSVSWAWYPLPTFILADLFHVMVAGLKMLVSAVESPPVTTSLPSARVEVPGQNMS
jgi:hypothetical protein